LSLYGFGSLDELRLFETLISVSGLGPKPPWDAFGHERRPVGDGDCLRQRRMLTTIPGIGKRPPTG